MTDRLSGLLKHFSLSARMFHAGYFCGGRRFDATPGSGHVHLIRRGPVSLRTPGHTPLTVTEPTLIFYPRPLTHDFATDTGENAELVCASVDFGGGGSNSLVQALPEILCVPLAVAPRLAGTLDLLFAEADDQQCGRQGVIDRLFEVLLIQLLRLVLDQGLASAGVLAGLADPRLARALAAMHEDVARAWSLDALAEVAGMSRARFAAHFHAVVGLTPFNYLSGWRVSLAQGLLRRGQSPARVAPAVGYASSQALARAFRAHAGQSPRNWLLTQASRPPISPVASTG